MPELDDPAIDPNVLSQELQKMKSGESVDFIGDPVHIEGTINPTDPLKPQDPDSALGSFGASAQPSMMPTHQATPNQSPREAEAEKLSIKRQKGITGALRDKLSQEQGGISLYKALAKTTGTHPQFKPSERHLNGSWINKKGGESHPKTLPHENPYDIKTWTSARLKQYNKDPYFHIKVKNRPGTKAERQQLAVSGQDDRVKHKDMIHLQTELYRRQTQNKNKLDYGSHKKGHTPGYRKEGDAPEKWSDHKTAHLHPRGIGPRAILKHKTPTNPPAKPSSDIASSSA